MGTTEDHPEKYRKLAEEMFDAELGSSLVIRKKRMSPFRKDTLKKDRRRKLINKMSERLKTIRLHTGLSKYALARVLRVSKYAVTQWESGQVLPHKANRQRINAIYKQRSEIPHSDGSFCISLTDSQEELITNPQPLRQHIKRKKKSMAESPSIFDRLTTGFLKKFKIGG